MKIGEHLTKNKLGKHFVYCENKVIVINNLHHAIEYAKKFDAIKILDDKNKIVWKK